MVLRLTFCAVLEKYFERISAAGTKTGGRIETLHRFYFPWAELGGREVYSAAIFYLVASILERNENPDLKALVSFAMSPIHLETIDIMVRAQDELAHHDIKEEHKIPASLLGKHGSSMMIMASIQFEQSRFERSSSFFVFRESHTDLTTAKSELKKHSDIKLLQAKDTFQLILTTTNSGNLHHQRQVVRHNPFF